MGKKLCWLCVVSLFFTLSSIAFSKTEDSPHALAQGTIETEQRGNQTQGLTAETKKLGNELFGYEFESRYERGTFDGKTLAESLEQVKPQREKKATPTKEQELPIFRAIGDMFLDLGQEAWSRGWNNVTARLKKWEDDKKGPGDLQLEEFTKRLKIAFDNWGKDKKTGELLTDRKPSDEKLLPAYEAWMQVKGEVEGKIKDLNSNFAAAAQSTDPNNAAKQKLFKDPAYSVGAQFLTKIQNELKTGGDAGKQWAHQALEAISFLLPTGGHGISVVDASGNPITLKLPSWDGKRWAQTEKAILAAQIPGFLFVGAPHDETLRAPTLAFVNGTWK